MSVGIEEVSENELGWLDKLSSPGWRYKNHKIGFWEASSGDLLRVVHLGTRTLGSLYMAIVQTLGNHSMGVLWCIQHMQGCTWDEPAVFQVL